MSDMSDNMSAASPAEAVETDSVDSVGSSANEPAMSAREFLTRRSELREKSSAEKTETDASFDKASQEAKVGDKEGSQPQEARENQANVKFQKRIDKLTARYHDAERKAAEKDIQIQKLTKATEILQKELNRYAQQVKLDPKQERILELEYQREIDEFTRGLDAKQEEIYTQSVSQYQVQQRADEILDEVTSLVEQYDLVSPEEVLLAMRDKGLTATQAARELHQQRLQRAQKRIGGSRHPATVSRKGAESISPVDEPYRGPETIKKFLLQRIAERGGVAE